jgi:hypothetical protein
MKLKFDFEDYLAEKFMEDFHGTKDQYEDAFDNWLSDRDGDDYINYANEFGVRLVGQITKDYEDDVVGNNADAYKAINRVVKEKYLR